MFGRNGYSTRVPNTNYYAISVTDNTYGVEYNTKLIKYLSLLSNPKKFQYKLYKNSSEWDKSHEKFNREVYSKKSKLQKWLLKRYPGKEIPSNWILTDIYHVGNDPLFHFRNSENSPWLSSAMIRDINFPHTALYRERIANRVSDDSFFEIALEKQRQVFKREPIFKAVFLGEEDVKTDFGGYVSYKVNLDSDHEFYSLQKARVNKDYAYSDKLKSEKIDYEIQFTKDGIYFFNNY